MHSTNLESLNVSFPCISANCIIWLPYLFATPSLPPSNPRVEIFKYKSSIGFHCKKLLFGKFLFTFDNFHPRLKHPSTQFLQWCPFNELAILHKYPLAFQVVDLQQCCWGMWIMICCALLGVPFCWTFLSEDYLVMLKKFIRYYLHKQNTMLSKAIGLFINGLNLIVPLNMLSVI